MTVTPEKVADVDQGSGPDILEGGLTAEEQAQFDAMQSGRDIPGQDATDGGEPAGDSDDELGDADASAADGADAESGDAPAADRDATAADGEADARGTPKSISYGKHQRALAKAQKAAAELQARLDGAVQETAKEREARVRLDERTKQLLEAISAAKPAAPTAAAVPDDPEPDADEDPIGNLQWKNKRLEKQVADLSGGVQQREAQTAAERDEQQLYTAFTSDLERASRADPAFGEAFVHLRESRYQELGFIFAGIDINDPTQCATLSPEDQGQLSQNIQRSFHNEQMLVAREALSKRRSPAEAVRNLARARGYAPKAAAVAAPTNGAAKPANGAAPPVVPAVPAGRTSVRDELQAIREGQEAARSLSDAGGSPGGSITPERLANMPEDEFEQLLSSMPKGQFDRIMGKVPQ